MVVYFLSLSKQAEDSEYSLREDVKLAMTT